ncbi:MAG: hypothetical protein AAF591_14485 [Verrucomicrobiota bacterium]
MAIKVQLGEAFDHILKDQEKLREVEEGNTLANSFTFKVGSGVFKGKTQTVKTANGSISAIIPYTGYVGSTLTPNLMLSGSATGVQNKEISFSINPLERRKYVEQHLLTRKVLDETIDQRTSGKKGIDRKYFKDRNIDIGTFIKDAVVAEYDQMKKLIYRGGVDKDGNALPYLPEIQTTQLKFTTSFIVALKFDADVSSMVFLPSPDINSLAPGLGADSENKGTYDVEITLPLLNSEPADNRKLIYSQIFRGNLITVEEPFTPDRFKEVTGVDKGEVPKEFPSGPGTAGTIQTERTAALVSDEIANLGNANFEFSAASFADIYTYLGVLSKDLNASPSLAKGPSVKEEIDELQSQIRPFINISPSDEKPSDEEITNVIKDLKDFRNKGLSGLREELEEIPPSRSGVTPILPEEGPPSF